MALVKIKITGHGKFIGFMDGEVSLQLEAERYGQGLESTLFDPSTKEIKRSNLVLLNGQPYINLARRLDSEVKDGDEIRLLPVLVGG
jgi:sulfur carrier protein ThiS